MVTFACCSACVAKESSCDVAWSLECLRCSRANAAARQSWSLLRVGDEPEKGLARKQLRWMVNDKLWPSEPHPAEDCLLCVPPMSMIWYIWRFSILSERNYRNLFQHPHWKTFKANTTFPIDHLSSQALAHSHHSIRVGWKVTDSCECVPPWSKQTLIIITWKFWLFSSIKQDDELTGWISFGQPNPTYNS